MNNLRRKTLQDLYDIIADAKDNRLYILRGGGKPKGVTASVQLTAKEYDEMREARQEVKAARQLVENSKTKEHNLAAFCAVGKQLINARANKRSTALLFKELERLVNACAEL